MAISEQLKEAGHKVIMLTQILYFRAVNYHKYGDPAENPAFNQFLEDLSDCWAVQAYEAVEQEQLSPVLKEAFHHKFDPAKDKPYWEEE